MSLSEVSTESPNYIRFRTAAEALPTLMKLREILVNGKPLSGNLFVQRYNCRELQPFLSMAVKKTFADMFVKLILSKDRKKSEVFIGILLSSPQSAWSYMVEHSGVTEEKQKAEEELVAASSTLPKSELNPFDMVNVMSFYLMLLEEEHQPSMDLIAGGNLCMVVSTSIKFQMQGDENCRIEWDYSGMLHAGYVLGLPSIYRWAVMAYLAVGDYWTLLSAIALTLNNPDVFTKIVQQKLVEVRGRLRENRFLDEDNENAYIEDFDMNEFYNLWEPRMEEACESVESLAWKNCFEQLRCTFCPEETSQ